MVLIVGLGNTGNNYQFNRHNVGFLIADRLQTTNYGGTWEKKEKLFAVVSRLKTVDCLLAKPTTMMNDSGKAVLALVKFYKVKLSDLYVVHDDLDIALGEYKIQFGKGPKVHNGLLSINEALGTLRLRSGQAGDYWRVRVGIENRGNKFSISNFKFSINFKNSNFINKNKKQISNIQYPISKRSKGKDYVLEDFTGEERDVVDGVIEEVAGKIREMLNEKTRFMISHFAPYE